jgi:prophage tail gpP-like protein
MATVTVLGLNGPLQGWKEVHVTQTFHKVAGEAQVKMSELPGRPMPLQLGQPTAVLIDGRPVITGYVNAVHGNLSERNHEICVTIRDKTQDFVDSTVGPNLKLQPPITPQQLVQRTVGVMGLGIGVINPVPEAPFEQGEVPSASIDERGFSFCDKWCQKRQLLMNTDGAGNIVLTRNMGLPASGMLYSGFEDSRQNNIKTSTYAVTDLNRHNVNAVNGQKSSNDQQWWESKDKGEATGQADPMQKSWGIGNDSTVRPQRKRYERGVQGLAGSSPNKAAQWRANTAKGNGFHYSATVQGFYGTPGASGGWLWWPGFIVPVFDPHWLLETALLISEVKFTKTWGGGESTTVTCTYPDAFSTDQGGGAAAGARTSSLGVGNVAPGTYDNGDAGLD